jgi:hypothetical protein
MVFAIQVGRGALMRVRKSPKTELVSCWIRGVVYFLTETVTCGCGVIEPLEVTSSGGQVKAS